MVRPSWFFSIQINVTKLRLEGEIVWMCFCKTTISIHYCYWIQGYDQNGGIGLSLELVFDYTSPLCLKSKRSCPLLTASSKFIYASSNGVWDVVFTAFPLTQGIPSSWKNTVVTPSEPLAAYIIENNQWFYYGLLNQKFHRSILLNCDIIHNH